MKFLPILLLLCLSVFSQDKKQPIVTGADQTELYFDYLKGKRVAILANPTTIVGKKHWVDSMIARGINIVKVFGPEHGFRGKASAGVKVSDEKDSATGIPIISLYGKKRKPSAEDLADVDLMVYDVQDVGCRFYTYINVLRDIMEACAENNKELMIMDRPNPNGYLIDGPILDMKYKSGIGQFPIPISHGMTIAELAQMYNGEGWMANGIKCKLKIIPVKNYKHHMQYDVPVWPSPNLNTQLAILLYPSTCLFEGVYVNHGRGTIYPFTVLGAPFLKNKYSFSYMPKSIPGMSETPLFMDQECYGLDLRDYDVKSLFTTKRIQLTWMIDLYKNFPEKEKFFDRTLSKQMGSIEYLAGVADFRKQIQDGKSIKEIQDSWEPGLSQYKSMRKKYTIYED